VETKERFEVNKLVKKVLKQILESLGEWITRDNNLERLRCDFEFLKLLEEDVVGKALKFLEKSKSQFFQDLFVLTELNFKKNGFFVEFGASNGVDFSNTYLLEKEFKWSGILAEPARVWHRDLSKNRSAKIEFECVWKESGKLLKFNEVKLAALSTISEFNSRDKYSEDRKLGKSYSVKTVSLLELLERHSAPREIDYLSIDTEGSEYEILKDFDFDAYNFSIITCEHNFTSNRERIYDLLISKGFARKFKDFSGFDDWYVRKKI